MEWIVQMDDGLVRPVDDEIILNQVVRSEAKEIHARSHQIAGLCGRRSFDHDTYRKVRFVLLPLQVKVLTNFGDDLVRRIEIVQSRNERQQDSRRAVY